ncbi:MAG: alpha/beta hydrolase [Pirellulales bacterium]|nr:alpha/beta hydrolase [Pirellulales bacterium]
MVRKLRAGDVELALHDQGSGPPILFVHGFPLDHSMWRGQLAASPLAGRFRLIAPDLRGFGSSSVTPGTVGMHEMADDLAALLDTLQIREPVVFVGLSMGGYVAWRFWERHAHRVRALVLCDTRSAPDTPEAAQGRRQFAASVLAEGTAPVATAMLPKLFAEQTATRQPEIVQAMEDVIVRTAPEGIAAALRGMAERPDATPLLATIRVPTLVLVGEHDAISPPAEMRKIADGIAGAQFVEVPDAGHMAPLENAAAVNAALVNFLEAPV